MANYSKEWDAKPRALTVNPAWFTEWQPVAEMLQKEAFYAPILSMRRMGALLFMTEGKNMKRSKGFTLIEMVIAISIMFIISASAIAFTRPYPKIRVSAAANNLASDIRYAQEMALTRRDIYGVYFCPSSEYYFLYYQNTANKLTSPVTGGEMRTNYLTTNEYNGVNLISASFGNRLQFNSSGAPTDSAGTLFTTEGIITLQNSSGYSATVRIEPETGKVKVQ